MARLQVLFGLGACWLSFSLPAAAQTRVACVGDSITEGYGLATPGQEAYPAQLGALLGADYAVRNFGVSGTTARKQGDKPYWNQAAYTQSTTFDPSVVLIMLGTNDAKPQNWDEAAFAADYTALVEVYRDLGARVLVATPPRVFANGAFDISPSTVANELTPLVRELAPQIGAELVEVFIATEDHAEWFPDTVHPSREGAAAIASAFATAIQKSPQTDAAASATGALSQVSAPAPAGGDATSAAALSSPSNASEESDTGGIDVEPNPPTVSPNTSTPEETSTSTSTPAPNPTASAVPTSTAPSTPSTVASSNNANTDAAPAPPKVSNSGCSLTTGSARLTGASGLGLTVVLLGVRRRARRSGPRPR